MKLVACDVKTILSFSWVCVVMGSGLFLPVLFCNIKTFSRRFFVPSLQEARRTLRISLTV